MQPYIRKPPSGADPFAMKVNEENELTQDFSKIDGARTTTRENIWRREFNIDPVGIYYRTSHGIKIVVPLQNDRDMIKYKFEYSDQWGNDVASGEIWVNYATNYYYSKVGGYVVGDFPFGEIVVGTGSSGEWIVYISSRETRNAQFRITEATGFNHKHVDNDYSYLVDVPTITATTSSGIVNLSSRPGAIAPMAKAANAFGSSAAYGSTVLLVNRGTTYSSGTLAIRKYEIRLPALIIATSTATWGVQLEIETYDAVAGSGKAWISFRYSAHYNAFYDYKYIWEGDEYPVMNDLLLGESGNRIILQFGDGVNTVANSRLVVKNVIINGQDANAMIPEDLTVHQWASTQWATLVDTQVVPIRFSHASQTIKTITSATTLDGTYDAVLADATSGAITVTLPPAADYEGKFYTIKKTDSSAYTVTIDGNASETIDGYLTKTILFQNTSLTLKSDGSNWYIA